MIKGTFQVKSVPYALSSGCIDERELLKLASQNYFQSLPQASAFQLPSYLLNLSFNKKCLHPPQNMVLFQSPSVFPGFLDAEDTARAFKANLCVLATQTLPSALQAALVRLPVQIKHMEPLSLLFAPIRLVRSTKAIVTHSRDQGRLGSFSNIDSLCLATAVFRAVVPRAAPPLQQLTEVARKAARKNLF